ncbi:peptide deformylase [Acidocella sp.]|uniref:peptide deformylase n=1 Tax=Acidocella sp. TaxID=50710 RepID=UPI0026312E6D|nr:peptide deformylase [Acidocella sp.]
MTILKIARMGHPVLRAPADAVADPTTPDLRRLVRAMTTTLEDAGGVGLAAPQVHEPVRLFLFFVPPARDPAGGGRGLMAVFNPVLTPLGDERVLGWEGCLSVPGLRGAVARHKTVRMTGLDGEGAPVDEVLSGFAARVAQHEADHLDGVLYPARVEDFRAFGYSEELERYPYPLTQG